MKRLQVGNIYEFVLPNENKRYFQFIGKDSTQLYGHVIRIFQKEYGKSETPTVEEIIAGNVEIYAHTFVNGGVTLGFWKYFGISKDTGSLDIVFRDAEDYGERPRENFVSHKWYVWKMNGPMVDVGTLPPKYYTAPVGLVFSPYSVKDYLENGTYGMKYYPDYK